MQGSQWAIPNPKLCSSNQMLEKQVHDKCRKINAKWVSTKRGKKHKLKLHKNLYKTKIKNKLVWNKGRPKKMKAIQTENEKEKIYI